MEIWSHPNEPLVKHLTEAIQNVECLLEKVFVPNIGITLNGEDLNLLIAKMCAGIHDIGKSTQYFQKYIRGNKKLNRGLTSHSKLGAIYAMWAVLQIPELSNIPYRDQLRAAFMVATIIHTHHGNLKELSKERKDLKEAYKDLNRPGHNLQKQLHSVNSSQVDKILESIGKQLGVTLPSWTSFQSLPKDELLKKMKKHLRKLGKENREYQQDCDRGVANPLGFSLAMVLQFLFSLLQDADKTSAMKKSIAARSGRDYLKDLIQYYKHNFGKYPIVSPPTNVIQSRPHIFNEAAHHAETTDFSGRVFTLEAPTGAAKTMASLRWAFGLRDRLKGRRIIYILPFTSIIDQVHKDLKEILRNASSNELLKHHYLSDIDYTLKDGGELSPNESAFYIEGWNTEIIVSTFYQLFHTIFSNRKDMLRKYSKFADSVIIMDEIQAFPPKYWGLFSSFLPRFLEFTNSYALLSTATMPGIMDVKPPSISTCGISTFDLVDRTQLNYIPEPVDVDDIVDFLEERNAFDCKSFLFVCNTVRSSQRIFKKLRVKFDDSTIFYLSASIVPKDRRDVISEVKCALKTEERVFLVSTQVIEAGIDLSFQRGFRDLAPLDSVIQAAGRINRSSEFGKDALYWVAPLIQNGRKTFLGSYVYDNLLLESTRAVLSKNPVIDEKKYREISQWYFDKVKEVKNTSSADLIKAVCKGEYYSLAENFHLIEERADQTPIFIEADEDAVKIWEEYQNIKYLDGWIDRRNAYTAIKPRMADYIINVSVRDCADFDLHNWIYHVNNDILDAYYDTTTGFIRKNDRDVSTIF